jgi:hypothetical protein
MSRKITPDHVGRAAVVYVRQSTMAQVTGNLESQRRQYDLAKAAEVAGFASVTVIDDDLGRSGSGTMQRPGFERLVAMVCSGDVGAVYHRGVALGAQRPGLASSYRPVRACWHAGCRSGWRL